MFPTEWIRQAERLTSDILDTTKFISIHHLEAPHFANRKLATFVAGGITDQWDTASIWYGTPIDQKAAVQKLVNEDLQLPVRLVRAIDYTEMTQIVEAALFTERTNLVIILEADADMSIEYAECIIAIGQKLINASSNSNPRGEGGIRLLTVARDPFDTRFQNLLEVAGEWRQFSFPHLHTMRAIYPEKCLIRQGPLRGLPRHLMAQTTINGDDTHDLESSQTRLIGNFNDDKNVFLDVAANINISDKDMHFVVCFEPWSDASSFASDPQGAIENMASFGLFAQQLSTNGPDPNKRLAERFTRWLQETAEAKEHNAQEGHKHVYLACVRDGTVPAFEIVNAELDPRWNLILVLGKEKQNCQYKQAIHQACTAYIEVGILEQWDQLSWLAALPGDAVVMDRYGWATDAAQRWRARIAGNPKNLDDEGAQHRRAGSSEVEARRLADFLVLVAAKQKQRRIPGLTVKRAIDALMKRHRPWRQVVAMLVYQGILTREIRPASTNSIHIDSQLSLIGGSDGPWMGVGSLRSLKYDYRLAFLFGGQPADAGADSCKILLAAAIQSGMAHLVSDDICSLDELARSDTQGEYDIKTLALSATGIFSSIAAFGTWWLKIGLWHSVGWSSGNFMDAILTGGPIPELYEKILFNGKQCKVSHAVTERMRNAVSKLSQILDNLHEVEQSPTPRTRSPLSQQAMSKQSLNIFYQHLTAAFILDLVVCRYVEGSGRQIKVHKVHGDLEMEPNSGYITAMIETILAGERTDFIFGIAPTPPIEGIHGDGTKMRRMEDWIWIPNQFVVDWHERHHPNEEFLAGIWTIT